MEKIIFEPEGEEPVAFFVLEQTRINGKSYILVTETEEDDSEALILKDLASDGDEESIYEIVSEETEFDALAEIFNSMLEDIDLKK